MPAAVEPRQRATNTKSKFVIGEIQPAEEEHVHVSARQQILGNRSWGSGTSEEGHLQRVMLMLTGLWVFLIGYGASQYDGMLPVREKLPLIWFDDAIKNVGPLLPAPVLLLRWYAEPLAVQAMERPASPRFAALLMLYTAVTAARAGLYALHLVVAPLLVAARVPGSHAHLLSDHVFLGASLVAIFTAEAHLIASDVRAAWHRLSRVQRAVILAAAALCAVLYALTCVEMHVTARHFHSPEESFWAVLVGLIVFQLPVFYFLKRFTGQDPSPARVE